MKMLLDVPPRYLKEFVNRDVHRQVIETLKDAKEAVAEHIF